MYGDVYGLYVVYMEKVWCVYSIYSMWFGGEYTVHVFGVYGCVCKVYMMCIYVLCMVFVSMCVVYTICV